MLELHKGLASYILIKLNLRVHGSNMLYSVDLRKCTFLRLSVAGKR